MKTIITKRNFEAYLPDDFVSIRSCMRLSNFKFIKKVEIGWDFEKERFMIHGNKIFFTGRHPRFLVWRLVIKLTEWLFPQKYELDYVSEKEITFR